MPWWASFHFVFLWGPITIMVWPIIRSERSEWIVSYRKTHFNNMFILWQAGLYHQYKGSAIHGWSRDTWFVPSKKKGNEEMSLLDHHYPSSFTCVRVCVCAYLLIWKCTNLSTIVTQDVWHGTIVTAAHNDLVCTHPTKKTHTQHIQHTNCESDYLDTRVETDMDMNALLWLNWTLLIADVWGDVSYLLRSRLLGDSSTRSYTTILLPTLAASMYGFPLCEEVSMDEFTLLIIFFCRFVRGCCCWLLFFFSWREKKSAL